jgi:hypothetical protein
MGAFAVITEQGENCISFILETGCLTRLIQLMVLKNVKIAFFALRSIGNIVSSNIFEP